MASPAPRLRLSTRVKSAVQRAGASADPELILALQLSAMASDDAAVPAAPVITSDPAHGSHSSSAVSGRRAGRKRGRGSASASTALSTLAPFPFAGSTPATAPHPADANMALLNPADAGDDIASPAPAVEPDARAAVDPVQMALYEAQEGEGGTTYVAHVDSNSMDEGAVPVVPTGVSMGPDQPAATIVEPDDSFNAGILSRTQVLASLDTSRYMPHAAVHGSPPVPEQEAVLVEHTPLPRREASMHSPLHMPSSTRAGATHMEEDVPPAPPVAAASVARMQRLSPSPVLVQVLTDSVPGPSDLTSPPRLIDRSPSDAPPPPPRDTQECDDDGDASSQDIVRRVKRPRMGVGVAVVPPARRPPTRLRHMAPLDASPSSLSSAPSPVRRKSPARKESPRASQSVLLQLAPPRPTLAKAPSPAPPLTTVASTPSATYDDFTVESTVSDVHVIVSPAAPRPASPPPPQRAAAASVQSPSMFTVSIAQHVANAPCEDKYFARHEIAAGAVHPHVVIAGVADGHGGETASAYVCAHLPQLLMDRIGGTRVLTVEETTAGIQGAFRACEAGFLAQTRETAAMMGITMDMPQWSRIICPGSCVNVVVIRLVISDAASAAPARAQYALFTANVGDSRAVLGRVGAADAPRTGVGSMYLHGIPQPYFEQAAAHRSEAASATADSASHPAEPARSGNTPAWAQRFAPVRPTAATRAAGVMGGISDRTYALQRELDAVVQCGWRSAQLSVDHTCLELSEARAVYQRSSDPYAVRTRGDRFDDVTLRSYVMTHSHSTLPSQLTSLDRGASPNTRNMLSRLHDVRRVFDRVDDYDPGMRVAGSLVVTRAIGDFYLKFPDLSIVKYATGCPYITSEAQVQVRMLTREDRFVIVATDGMWEVVKNDDAVYTAAHALASIGSRPVGDDADAPATSTHVHVYDDSHVSRLQHVADCFRGDPAQRLMGLSMFNAYTRCVADARARGGRMGSGRHAPSSLANMLFELPQRERRGMHDDCTVVVVTLPWAHALIGAAPVPAEPVSPRIRPASSAANVGSTSHIAANGHALSQRDDRRGAASVPTSSAVPAPASQSAPARTRTLAATTSLVHSTHSTSGSSSLPAAMPRAPVLSSRVYVPPLAPSRSTSFQSVMSTMPRSASVGPQPRLSSSFARASVLMESQVRNTGTASRVLSMVTTGTTNSAAVSMPWHMSSSAARHSAPPSVVACPTPINTTTAVPAGATGGARVVHLYSNRADDEDDIVEDLI